ncbi:MAG: chemotaxis protein CheA [Myxococcaceae bacterium]|nr:chemotaxis protein CheA [Myxococcaceae bacterium]
MGRHVERDAETVELHGDFLEEAHEGLARAEELLAHPLDAEGVAGLFRVFHTLKGNAGFLELEPAVELAHTVETLLAQYRDGVKAPKPALLLEATAVASRLVEAVRLAVEQRAEVAPPEELQPFVARLRDEIGRAGEGAQALVEGERGPAVLRETIRVDAERLDTLVEMVGELLVVQSMVTDAPELTSARAKKGLGQLTRLGRELHAQAMRLRMVPLRGLFQKVSRMAGDLSRKTGKPLRLLRDGDEVELDRAMVDKLEEPLLHLLRNAIDHGVEPAADRRAAGKPVEATLTLRALHQGGRVNISLIDDGRGLRRGAILEKARARGLAAPGAEPADAEVWGFIFEPGFSTAAQVTELSGRGVGLDVVKRQVEGLRGRVTVETQPQRGTTFTLSLPLTLAVIDGMLVACREERYVIPSLAVLESLRPAAASWVTLAGQHELVDLRGELLPVIRLDEVLAVPGRRATGPDLAVIVAGQGQKAALVVSDVLAEQQVVIKPLAPGARSADYLSGVAILADGRPGMVLDVERLLAHLGQARGAAA